MRQWFVHIVFHLLNWEVRDTVVPAGPAQKVDILYVKESSQ